MKFCKDEDISAYTYLRQYFVNHTNPMKIYLKKIKIYIYFRPIYQGG